MMDVSSNELARLRIERDEYKRKCEALRSALEQYADHSNWSDKATFTYDTGVVRSDGYAEEAEGHVNIDSDAVWQGDGNGYDIAEEALK